MRCGIHPPKRRTERVANSPIVFDHNLNTAINKIREVLGDSAENPRFVETLPRRGYRFIAPIEEIHSPAASSAAGSHPTEPRDDSSTAAIVSPVAATASASGEQLAAGANAKRRLTLPRIALLSAAILAFAVLSGVAVH